MSKFKKSAKKKQAQVSTASLPDIVFMLLFFFMVVTVIRQKEALVDVKLPKASELTKLVDPRKTEHIYIGKPRRSEPNAAPAIQINDKFVKKDGVAPAISGSGLENETVALKVDKGVTMGIVTDVKTEIRKANRLKVQYMAYQDVVD